MNLDKIDHIAIQVDNIQESLNWYLNNFKCKKIYSDRTWAFIEFNNIKLALVDKKQNPNHFAIIDTKIILDVNSKKHRDGSISKYINDIDNNKIELINYGKIKNQIDDNGIGHKD